MAIDDDRMGCLVDASGLNRRHHYDRQLSIPTNTHFAFVANSI